MFNWLKALFKNNNQSSAPVRARRTNSSHSPTVHAPKGRSSGATRFAADSSSGGSSSSDWSNPSNLLSPLHPLNPLNPLSPLNPLNSTPSSASDDGFDSQDSLTRNPVDTAFPEPTCSAPQYSNSWDNDHASSSSSSWSSNSDSYSSYSSDSSSSSCGGGD